jgi:hypothetical protein
MKGPFLLSWVSRHPSEPPQGIFLACSRVWHASSNCPLRRGSWAAYRRVHRVVEHSTLLYWNLPLRSASLLSTWLCTYISLIPWWLTPIPRWWAYGWRTLGPYGPDILQVPLGCLVGFPARSPLDLLGDTWQVPWIYLYTHSALLQWPRCSNQYHTKPMLASVIDEPWVAIHKLFNVSKAV